MEAASPYNPGATIEGTSIVVRFTWAAVAKLQAKYGNLDCFKRMGAVLAERDLVGISEIVAAGVEGHTGESFMALSLPLNPTIEAAQDAWLIFLWGPEKKEAEGRQDANPPKAQPTSFVPRLLRLLGRASIGPNSGTSQPSKPH